MSTATKSAAAKVYREQMRSGVILRAATFKDRKKHASKNACRGKVTW